MEKLEKTLASIPDLDYIDIIIICDNDYDTYGYIRSLKNQKIFAVMALASHQNFIGSVACKNLYTPDVVDGLLYGTDDIIFKENAIQNAFIRFNESFPDNDGVVGFIQEGNSFHPTGVGLVGQKFLQRYPDKKLFFPGYFHFACQEIYDLCNKIGGKFIQAKDAVVLHKHPCNYKEEMDQTHQDARIKKREDHAMIAKRKAEGLIWGHNDD